MAPNVARRRMAPNVARRRMAPNVARRRMAPNVARRRMAPNVAAIGRLLSLRPWQKKKSPGAGIAEARTHYTERTTTQTRYYRARIECLGPMAVLRRFLVDLAFNNKDLAVSPHPQWLIFRCPSRPLKAPLALVGKPVPCRMDGYFRHVR